MLQYRLKLMNSLVSWQVVSALVRKICLEILLLLQRKGCSISVFDLWFFLEQNFSKPEQPVQGFKR